MTLYVRTDYVPDRSLSFLTQNKLYKVVEIIGKGFGAKITADDGKLDVIILKGKCSHIGKEWEQVTLEDEE